MKTIYTNFIKDEFNYNLIVLHEDLLHLFHAASVKEAVIYDAKECNISISPNYSLSELAALEGRKFACTVSGCTHIESISKTGFFLKSTTQNNFLGLRMEIFIDGCWDRRVQMEITSLPQLQSCNEINTNCLIL